MIQARVRLEPHVGQHDGARRVASAVAVDGADCSVCLAPAQVLASAAHNHELELALVDAAGANGGQARRLGASHTRAVVCRRGGSRAAPCRADDLTAQPHRAIGKAAQLIQPLPWPFLAGSTAQIAEVGIGVPVFARLAGMVLSGRTLRRAWRIATPARCPGAYEARERWLPRDTRRMLAANWPG